jgi:Fe-S-cluster containining protein
MSSSAPATAHVCARCPTATGRSCCEVDGDVRLATLTGGDIRRIQAETGLDPSRFTERQVIGPEEQHAYEALRPANRHVIRGGQRVHLRTDGRACVFHTAATGCTLSKEARPLFCKLYPFEFNALGKLTVEPVGACLAVAEQDGFAGLLRAFGVSRPKLQALHDQIQVELAADASPAAGRASQRDATDGDPS